MIKSEKSFSPQDKEHDKFLAILKQASELRWKKNCAYGSAYKSHGSFGVAVRMTDKMFRINNLLKTKEKSALLAESLRDTAIDLLNYSAMFIMLLDEENT